MRTESRSGGRSHVILLTLATTAVATLLVLARPAHAATRYPGVLEIRTIGYSVGHRPIRAYRMGDPTSKVKAVILGQMHGDEHAGVVVTKTIIAGNPVHGADVWVIPTMNPDGDLARRRQNDHGVDLNRNWPYMWKHLTGQYYSGPAPLSEPESRAMYAFLAKIRPTFMVSLHQPLDGVDTTDGGARNRAFRDRLARNLRLPERALVCWSACHGNMTGWLTRVQPGSAITVEFPAHPSTAYLAGTAGRGILSAMGVRYGWSALHNPRGFLNQATATSSRTAGRASLHGWSVDPDHTSTAVSIRVTEGTVTRWRGTTTIGRPGVNRALHVRGLHGYAGTFAASPGRHTYCVVMVNLGPGTGNPRVCAGVTVPKLRLPAAPSR